VGGVYGGAARAATLRALPKEENQTATSAMGMDFGAGWVPFLDPGARLVTGTTASDAPASRLLAGGELLLQIAPGVLELASGARGSAGALANKKALDAVKAALEVPAGEVPAPALGTDERLAQAAAQLTARDASVLPPEVQAHVARAEGLSAARAAPPGAEPIVGTGSADPPKPELLHNTLPDELRLELKIADDLKVKPAELGTPEFDKMANEGTVKWVLDPNMKPQFVPKFRGGVEIKHTVPTRGGPVWAAGEGDIAGQKGKYIVIELNPNSGHYQTPPENFDLAKSVFAKLGLPF
jgi:hypothetical protein